MLEKRHRYLYHILLAVVVIVMDVFGDYVYNGMEGFRMNFTFPGYTFFSSFNVTFWTTYLLHYYVICPRFLSMRRIGGFLLACLGVICFFAGVRFLLDEVLIQALTGKNNYFMDSLTVFYYVFDNSYYALKAVLFATSLYLLFQFIDERERIHQLEVEHKKAELSLLKGQIEPHFLFNTLNAFYTDLVDTQPDTAKDIHTLSELLRYVTYEAKEDFMPVHRELEFIDHYLALYRKRYEDSLALDYTIEGVVAQQKIPSLVLIYFVENVFKHGIVTDKSDPAMIDIRVGESSIDIRTANRIDRSEKYTAEGIGSANLERRMEALFPGGYEFEQRAEDGLFTSYLRIPIEPPTT